jgi:hypothetical protein
MTKTIAIAAVTSIVVLATAIIINKARVKKGKKSMF